MEKKGKKEEKLIKRVGVLGVGTKRFVFVMCDKPYFGPYLKVPLSFNKTTWPQLIVWICNFWTLFYLFIGLPLLHLF